MKNRNTLKRLLGIWLRQAAMLPLGAVLCWGQLVCPPPGTMASGGNSIGTIRDGDLLTGNESWYDGPTSSLQIKLIQPTTNDCEIRVNGLTPYLKRNGNLVVDVPVGPAVPSPQWATSPFIYEGLTFSDIAYVDMLTDPQRVNKPLIYELIDVRTLKVLVRTKIVIRDKRRDPTFTPERPAAPLPYSMGSEISTTGINKLERVHTSTLPQPNPVGFNLLLTNSFRNAAQTLAPTTDFGNNGKACMPLSSADPAFLQSSAYAAVRAAAVTEFAVWKTADTNCKNNPNPVLKAIACAASTASCVRDGTPTAANFELCVGRIDGASRTLTMAGVTSTDLQIGNANPIESHVVLGRLDGTVDGTLGDIFIRWSDQHPACVTRPKKDLDPNDYNSQDIRNWVACRGLEVDSAFEVSNLISHPLTPFIELLNARATANLPLFVLDPTHPRNPDKGACANAHLRGHVNGLLDSYYPAMQTAIDSNWLPQHGNAMDDLTARLEPGDWEEMPDLTATITPTSLAQRRNDRLSMYYHTTFTSPAAQVPTAWSRPGPFPCVDPPGGGVALLPCMSGLSLYGDPFDASYTVTTNTLNQVVTQRRRQLEIVPTFGQLNVPPPPGKTANDPWELDFAALAALVPGFTAFGNTRLTIKMSPTDMPFVWMPQDPAYWYVNGQKRNRVNNPQGKTPVTYQISQYVISFIGNNPGPDGTDSWLKFLVDFQDPDIQLDLAANAGQNKIVPAYGVNKNYVVTLVKNQFAGCPVTPFPPKAVWCGERLTAAVTQWVTPLLEQTLLTLLQGFPAPQLYDANGKSNVPRRLTQTKKFQEQSVITFYGDLQ